MNDLMKTAAMLCDMDGICGYEDDVRYCIREMVKPYAQEILTDHMGNLLVFVRGEKRRAAPVLICAHMDEVGAIVFRVSEDGSISSQSATWIAVFFWESAFISDVTDSLA